VSDITFQETFKIRASEIDFNQRATLPAICNLLQEVAGNHARELEFDITDLQKDKLTWVLHRIHVQMDRFPEWRETITIKTWPSSGDGLRAYRDFLIIDENGNIIGKSLSYWLIMNIKSRRPARIPKKILEMAPENANHVLPVTDATFPKIDQPDYLEEFQVRKTDLDLNRHVNNVHFIEWALASLPNDATVNEIDIQFTAESVLGDTDIVEVKEQSANSSKKYFNYQIRRASDDKVLAKASSN
jgi:acyl-ACP thioesterase